MDWQREGLMFWGITPGHIRQGAKRLQNPDFLLLFPFIRSMSEKRLKC
jgi:hypothetical protein